METFAYRVLRTVIYHGKERVDLVCSRCRWPVRPDQRHCNCMATLLEPK